MVLVDEQNILHTATQLQMLPSPALLFKRIADILSLPTAQFSFRHHLKAPSPFYQRKELI